MQLPHYGPTKLLSGCRHPGIFSPGKGICIWYFGIWYLYLVFWVVYLVFGICICYFGWRIWYLYLYLVFWVAYLVFGIWDIQWCLITAENFTFYLLLCNCPPTLVNCFIAGRHIYWAWSSNHGNFVKENFSRVDIIGQSMIPSWTAFIFRTGDYHHYHLSHQHIHYRRNDHDYHHQY